MVNLEHCYQTLIVEIRFTDPEVLIRIASLMLVRSLCHLVREAKLDVPFSSYKFGTYSAQASELRISYTYDHIVTSCDALDSISWKRDVLEEL